MAELKTKVNDADVERFLEGVADEQRRQDCHIILEMMRQATGAPPKMWGESIVGFGSQHYKYESGREGDWPLTGFSPRKQNLTLYLVYGFERHAGLMQRLGKYKIGKACLYIKKLQDVDLTVLNELVLASVEEVRRGNPISSH